MMRSLMLVGASVVCASAMDATVITTLQLTETTCEDIDRSDYSNELSTDDINDILTFEGFTPTADVSIACDPFDDQLTEFTLSAMYPNRTFAARAAESIASYDLRNTGLSFVGTPGVQDYYATVPFDRYTNLTEFSMESFQMEFITEIADFLELDADTLSTDNFGTRYDDRLQLRMVFEIEADRDLFVEEISNRDNQIFVGTIARAIYVPAESVESDNNLAGVYAAIGVIVVILVGICLAKRSMDHTKALDEENPIDAEVNDDVVVNRPAAPAGKAEPLPAGWEYIKNNGDPYYWHDATGTSVWNKPTADTPTQGSH